MIHSEIISRSKDQTPQSRYSDRNLSQKSSRQSNSQLTIFKLRIINLSSENITIKKKLADCREALNKAKMYQVAFNNAVRVIKQLMHKNGQHVNRKELENMNLQSCEFGNPTIKKTHSQEIQNYQMTQRVEPYKLQQYDFLKQLVPGKGHQTLQSLQLSLDTEQIVSEYKQTEKNESQDLFALRQQYETAKQNLQNIYKAKINTLNEKIEELKRQNQRLQNKLKQKQSQNYILEIPELQGRQTAYFPQIDTISQKEFQEQIDASEGDKSLDACLKKIQKQNNSMISENWTQAADQMRSVKTTLQKLYRILGNGTSDIRSILEIFYQLNQMTQKYTSLLQTKKENVLVIQRCNILQKQISKLKTMIRGLL